MAAGRDKSSLQSMYHELKNVDVCDYAELEHVKNCDTLIHLAVYNNNQPGDLAKFKNINTELSEFACKIFEGASGRRFIYLSSIHSLIKAKTSSYSISKDISLEILTEKLGGKLDNLYISYFYGHNYFGSRLNFLIYFGPMGAMLFNLFKAIKPTTSASLLADYICSDDIYPSKLKILSENASRNYVYSFLSRTIDVTFSLVILLGLLPLLIALWVVVKFDSPGPGIFSQKRVGRNLKPFTLYKFRTMKRDTDSVSTHEVASSAVTKIGRFLRSSKLDELPQALNLLRGDMTLVGPRPCLYTQDELITARKDKGIFDFKPGITGYAQIRGVDMSDPERLSRYDYICTKLKCLSIDFSTLAKTILGAGRGDRVKIR